jgi:hypothetical protein
LDDTLIVCPFSTLGTLRDVTYKTIENMTEVAAWWSGVSAVQIKIEWDLDPDIIRDGKIMA